LQRRDAVVHGVGVIGREGVDGEKVAVEDGEKGNGSVGR
jgi:hypothetical protein